MTGIRLMDVTADRDKWMQARRAGIGASEIAAVAGLARSRGPWDVWDAKVHGDTSPPTREQAWGLWIEQQIIDYWAQEEGVYVADGGLYRHPVHEWLLATPDALVVTDPEDPEPVPTAVVDAKNSGWRLEHEWDDEGAPIEYICQITQQMLAVDVPEGWLVAALGGKPPMGRRFALDPELGDLLVRYGDEFWPYVQHQTPPPLDSSASAARWVSARYADADPKAIAQLDDHDIAKIGEWLALDERIKALERAKEGVETAIKDRLGTAQIGSFKDRTHVTWKTVERAGYTVEPGKYRRFYVPKQIREELSGHGHS